MRRPVHPHLLYGRLLVFDKTLAQPHFSVVNCLDELMSVLYSTTLTRSLIFCSYELLYRSVERWVYFPLIS